MEECLAKYLFWSEKKIQHFNLDLSALPVSPTGALYTSQLALSDTQIDSIQILNFAQN